jgi:hypothetical protein
MLLLLKSLLFRCGSRSCFLFPDPMRQRCTLGNSVSGSFPPRSRTASRTIFSCFLLRKSLSTIFAGILPCISHREYIGKFRLNFVRSTTKAKFCGVHFSSLLKNAVKNSSVERDALCFILRKLSAPIEEEKAHSARKYGQSTRKQPKRRQRGPLLALDDACLHAFSANASDFAQQPASTLHH